MIHKSILLIILIINYFSTGFSGFYENFEEYKNKQRFKNKKINYFTLQNSIETKYFKCLEHYNQYVKPIQDKKNTKHEQYDEHNELSEDSTLLYESNIKDNGVTFENYLEYWWNLEESEDDLLNKVCDFINNKYPKKYIRLGK